MRKLKFKSTKRWPTALFIITLLMIYSVALGQQGTPFLKVIVDENGNIKVFDMNGNPVGNGQDQDKEPQSTIHLDSKTILQDLQSSQDPEAVEYRKRLQEKGIIQSGGEAVLHDLETSQEPEVLEYRKQLQEKGTSQSGGKAVLHDLETSQDPEAVEYRKRLQEKGIIQSGGEAVLHDLETSQEPEALEYRKQLQEKQNKLALDPTATPNLTFDFNNTTWSYNSTTHVLSLTARVLNNGSTTAAASQLGYYLSTNNSITTTDSRIGTDAVGSLAAGGFSDQSFSADLCTVSGTPSFTIPGTYFIGWLCDYLGQVSESNENDNAAISTSSISVICVDCTLPDLATTGSGIALDGTNQSFHIYRFDCKYYLINISKAMYPGGLLPSLNNPAGVIATYNALLNNDNSPNAGNIVFDPNDDSNFDDNTGLRAAVSAHKFTGTVYDYFFNIHNRNSWDNQGTSLVSIVHGIPEVGNHLPNDAFWNGSYATYGDGDGTNYRNFAAGLDIVAHELTHGVTAAEANLVYHLQPGALNESFSDVFAALVDNNDWLIGEDVRIGGALRSMENPPLYNQPEHMDNFVVLPDDEDHDNGGVHTNSGIPNKSFYLVATTLNREKAGKIWYRMLTNILVSNSQFIDCANAAIQSASDLYGSNSPERQAVRNAFRQVGILPNASPTITSTPPTTARVNTPYSYQMTATDSDGDPLTYSLITKPAGMTINSSTGLITWTPTQMNPNVPVTARVSDGSDNTEQDWTINVSDGGGNTIAGLVSYYKNNTAVREVSMALTGSSTQTVPTDANGRYQFNNLASGSNYTVTPSKGGGVGNAISAFDAAQVLQHTVGIITLDANQQKAADVSNNGSVSSFDAALILQYTVGIITSFPVGQSWGFVPNSKSYTTLTASLSSENYFGLVYGDVSGNWTGTSPTLAKSTNQTAQLFFASVPLEQEKQLHLPLKVLANEDISGLLVQLTLDFDYSLLLGVELADRDDDGLVAYSRQNSLITVAAAFVNRKVEQEVHLVFDSKALGQSLEATALAVNDADAWALSQQVTLQGTAVELPKNFELSQNYPNPFNPSTTIQFSLPHATDVVIRIFNINGQLVKTLHQGYMQAGTHKLQWDGLDEVGQPVSSGLFILEMNAGEFHGRRKVIVLK